LSQVKDLTFTKSIQGLFTKYPERNILSQAYSENVYTEMATARALENAAGLQIEKNVLFFEMPEAITRNEYK
jgi:hypothetical protein